MPSTLQDQNNTAMIWILSGARSTNLSSKSLEYRRLAAEPSVKLTRLGTLERLGVVKPSQDKTIRPVQSIC